MGIPTKRPKARRGLEAQHGATARMRRDHMAPEPEAWVFRALASERLA